MKGMPFVRPEDVLRKEPKLIYHLGALVVLFFLTAAAMIENGLLPFAYSVYVLVWEHPMRPASSRRVALWVGVLIAALLIGALLFSLATGTYTRAIREHGYVFWRLALWAIDWVVAIWFGVRVYKARTRAAV